MPLDRFSFADARVWILVVFLSNALWEVVQTPLYSATTLVFATNSTPSLFDGHYLLILLYASLGDIFYCACIYGWIRLAWGQSILSSRWATREILTCIIAGLIVATMIEWRGLALGHWHYSALMPIVPMLGVGLSPFIQLAATSVFAQYVLKALRCKPAYKR